MDESESNQNEQSDMSEFPAHSLAMSCVGSTTDNSAKPSCSQEASNFSTQADAEQSADTQKDVVKRKSFSSLLTSWKWKSDKKKGGGFFKKFNCVQNQSKDKVGTRDSVTLSDNNVNNDIETNSANTQDSANAATEQYSDASAISHPAHNTTSTSFSPGSLSPANMGAGPSSPVRLSIHRLLAAVPAPPPQTLRYDLRQVVPIASEALEENIRREMQGNRWRDHVAYPHLHYPTSSRSSASESSSNDSMPNLAATFRTQCSTSVPHYPGASATSSLSTFGQRDGVLMPLFVRGFSDVPPMPKTEFTQVDYAHFMVPDLLEISRCGFYWGVMDRYEAERLLDNKREGTFLLRDSAQEEYLFSVSFRRYGRSLHARIDQWHHRFSFDTHDSGVFSADSVTGLIEHYKDPSSCMFFEPMLTIPLSRNFPFSLQHLARAAICKNSTYDGINLLPLPKPLIEYLKYYHYKLVVNKRKVEMPMQQKVRK